MNSFHHEHEWGVWHDADASCRWPDTLKVYQVRTCLDFACGLIESRTQPQVIA